LNEPQLDAHHDAFRELISARLDSSIDIDQEGQLSAHLQACSRCHQFDHDLTEQRGLLRALRPLIPPRDLWARTSAALDRELLREARWGTRGSAHHASPRASGRLGELSNPRSVPSVVMVSMTSLGLAVGLLITQLGPALRLPNDGGAGQPTPFGAAGVALAFVGADEGGLTLYRTRVDQACPDPTNCDQEDEAVAARVTFPASFRANNLALAPRGDRLAIMGSDNERENVFAVMVVPPLEPLSPDADYPNRPRSTAPSAPEPTFATLGPGSSVVFVGRTPPPSTPPNGPASTPVIPAELSVSTILDGVYGVGAAPAWSADGQALAFSAMPSDRSRGPDIYVWRVGDDRAQPITSDHGSYFASWSRGVIVVSRASRASRESEETLLGAAPVLRTVAIDPATSEERVVDADGLWLPQIDPNSRRAVAWHGGLAWDGTQVVPTHGALYLLDWASIDPFAAQTPAQTPDGGDVDLSGTDLFGGAQDSTAVQSAGPDVAETDEAAPAPAATAQPALPRAIATEAATPRPLDRRLVAIEPGRDPLQHPVTDWRVLWSIDGRVLGLWIGDVDPTTAWGHLSVLSVDLQGSLDRAMPILGSTLAKRGFNLGTNRVAWVAPLEGAPSGELRLRMWSGGVVSDVRVKPLESTGVVAAF
jgi:hypothetical protein